MIATVCVLTNKDKKKQYGKNEYRKLVGMVGL